MKIRTALASFLTTAILGVGVLGLAAPANAYVSTNSGAHADTVLVCQRLYGAYAIGTQSSGFHYLRMYTLNSSGAGAWGNWVTPAQVANAGFGLPTRGQLAVYVQYAQWNGAAWEFVGEWGKVLNARGQFVSWYC